MHIPSRDNIDTNNKLRDYIQSEGLVGCMSDTKWKRLYENIILMDGKVDVRRKDLDEDLPSRWEGDLYFMMGGLQYVEWMELKAVVETSNGSLVSPTVTYYTKELVEAIQRSSVAYEHVDEHIVRITGYLQPSS